MQFDSLMKKLAKPAQRALDAEGITSIDQLSKYSEKELLALHGMGRNGLNVIKLTLLESGRSLKPPS
jgi:hypothetical protein